MTTAGNTPAPPGPDQYRLQHQITRYDLGRTYTASSTWTSISDIGRVFDDGELTAAEYYRFEALYLHAVALLLDAAGVTALTVTDMELTDDTDDTVPVIADGTTVTVAEALELVRRELREEITCRLVDDRGGSITFGFDYYLYVVTTRPLLVTVDCIRELGLSVRLRDDPRDFRYQLVDDPDG